AAVLIGVAAVAAAGAGTAALLALTTGSDAAGTTSTHARTNTITRTVTTTATPPPATPARNQSQNEGQSPSALNDAGYRDPQAGNAEAALPLLERAVSGLSGSGSITEAYASYNLAWARFAVGRCDGVLALLDRSQELQGKRKEIDQLRKQVERRCDGGDGPK